MRGKSKVVAVAKTMEFEQVVLITKAVQGLGVMLFAMMLSA